MPKKKTARPKTRKTAREAVIEKIMAKVNETCEHAMEDLIVKPADLEEIEAMLFEAVK